MKNKLLLLSLMVFFQHSSAAAAQSPKSLADLFQDEQKGDRFQKIFSALAIALTENPNLVVDYHLKDPNFMKLIRHFNAQAALADDISYKEMANVTPKAEKECEPIKIQHAYQNRRLQDGQKPSKDYLASFFPAGTSEDLFIHHDSIEREFRRVATLLEISVLQHKVLVERAKVSANYIKRSKISKARALSLKAKLGIIFVERKDIPRIQALIPRILEMHPSRFNAMLLYLELLASFGTTESELNQSEKMNFSGVAPMNESKKQLQKVHYIQREILNRLWPWANEAINLIGGKILLKRINPDFDLSVYVDVSALSDDSDEIPAAKKKKKPKKKNVVLPLKPIFALQPMVRVDAQVPPSSLQVSDEQKEPAAWPQGSAEPVGHIDGDQNDTKDLSDDEGDEENQAAAPSSAAALLAPVSRFAYKIPEPSHVDEVFGRLNKKRQNILNRIFSKNKTKQDGSDITNKDIENLARHLVKALGLYGSDYAKKFLKDLETKRHEPHSSDSGNRLPVSWMPYPRAVFIRWGLFPSNFLECDEYKKGSLSLDALDTYAVRRGVSLDD